MINEEYRKIQELISRLQQMHAGQMASFEGETLPDIEQQSAERARAVSRLIVSVNRFISQAGELPAEESEPGLLMIHNSISILLAQNRNLEHKVRKIRDDLRKGMKRISDGKSVIGSYRSSRATAGSPKVISVTN